MDAFDGLVSPLLRQLGKNSQGNAALAALRDTLLPKLISGELRVSEAARMAEGTLQSAAPVTSDQPNRSLAISRRPGLPSAMPRRIETIRRFRAARVEDAAVSLDLAITPADTNVGVTRHLRANLAIDEQCLQGIDS